MDTQKTKYKTPVAGDLMYVPSCRFRCVFSSPPQPSQMELPNEEGKLVLISPAYDFIEHHRKFQKGVVGGIAEVSSVNRYSNRIYVDFEEIGISFQLKVLMPIQQFLRNHYKHHSARIEIDTELERMFNDGREDHDW